MTGRVWAQRGQKTGKRKTTLHTIPNPWFLFPWREQRNVASDERTNGPKLLGRELVVSCIGRADCSAVVWWFGVPRRPGQNALACRRCVRCGADPRGEHCRQHPSSLRVPCSRCGGLLPTDHSPNVLAAVRAILGDREALRSVLAKVRIRGGLPRRPPEANPRVEIVTRKAPPPAMPWQVTH